MPSQSPTFLLAKNLRSLGGTAGRRGWTEDGPERGEPGWGGEPRRRGGTKGPSQMGRMGWWRVGAVVA